MTKLFSFIAIACLFAANSMAAVVTFTATAGPANNPDANSSFAGAVDLWTPTTNGPNAGSFYNGSSWGLFGNSGNEVISNSQSFTSLGGVSKSLDSASESVSFTIDHGNIDNGGSIGVFLRDSSNNVVSTVFFNGGDNNYRISDGTGANSATGVNFNSNPFTIGFTLDNNSGAYTLNLNGNNFVRQLNGTNINSIHVFNNNAGNGGAADLLFNNLAINTVTAVPEPSSLLLVAGAMGGMLWKRKRLFQKSL